MRVEPVSCVIGLGVQAERLPSIKREHGVVEAVGLLVLVENGLGGQQLAKQRVLRPRSVTVTWRAQWATAGWAAAISAPTALPAAGPLSLGCGCGSRLQQELPLDGAAGEPDVCLRGLAEGEAAGDPRAEEATADLLQHGAEGACPRWRAAEVVAGRDPAQGQRARAAGPGDA